MPSTVQPSQAYPAYFIGHAGVGLLFNESSNNKTVQDNLRSIGKEILSLSPRPKALIVFSGHFEAGEIHGPGVIEGENWLSITKSILPRKVTLMRGI
jgi:aromatic ring-opening dioxygenase catalytic subunit (LigB family)